MTQERSGLPPSSTPGAPTRRLPPGFAIKPYAISGAAVVALGVAAAWFLTAGAGTDGTYQWNFAVVRPYLGFLLEGLVLTLKLTLVSIVLGMVIGVLIAAMRLAHFPLLRWLSAGYIEVARCTPVLVQLVWVFYALPILTGVRLSGFTAAVVALTFNVSAFYGESFRSGIQAVPKEQVEAAEILGLSYLQRMRFVILPQATRIVIPVLLGLSVSLFKDTALVSVLGLSDLMNNSKTAALTVYRPMEILSVAALMYFLVAFPLTVVVRRLELRLSKHRR